MKKALAIILSAALMLVCLSSFAVTFASSYVKATGSAHIRTGPGTGYASIGSIRKGSTLPYLGAASTDSRNVTWYKVSFGSSYGWISSVHATFTDTYTPPTISSGGDLYGGANNNGGYQPVIPSASVRTTGNVYIRTGPGLGYDQIGSVKKDTTLPFLGTQSIDERGVTWYLISFEGRSAWISSVYAQLMGTDNGYYGTTVTAVSGNTNLRTGPGLGYADIGTMMEDDSAAFMGSVSLDERGVAWYYVNFGGTLGWVSSRYTTLY